MKRTILAVAAAIMFGLFTSTVIAEDAKKESKTVSGKSACATCDGVTEKGHNIMLVDESGSRWVLIGDSESYKKAHKVRDQGKKMTATLAGEAQTKKDENGKEYKEVKVSDVKVDEA